VVILPIPVDPPRVDPGEFSAGKAAARTLGLTLRLAESLVGDPDAMAMMLRARDRGVEAGGGVRAGTGRPPSRPGRPPHAWRPRPRTASHRVRVPDRHVPVDVRPQIASSTSQGYLPLKAEALEHFEESGTTRKDLDPELAYAYARYWGRLKDFGEVEVFEIIQEKDS
jgi:hypothetical protein